MTEPTLKEIAENHPSIYRECAERFLRMFYHAIQRQRDSVEKWGIAFATSNPICMGMSMSEVAKRLGVSRAAISYEATRFCDEHGLPHSSYMKSEKAVVIATNARKRKIKELSKNEK